MTTSLTRWDELQVDQSLPDLVADPLTITGFVRYQGAANDRNPIHHDTEFARRAGYEGPFAVGMLQASLLANYAADQFGPRNVRRFTAQFREQAWPGDVITYSGRVVAKREEDGQRLVDLELTATRHTGGVHVRGKATYVVPD